MMLAFSLLKMSWSSSSSNLSRKLTTACLSCRWSLAVDRTSSERPCLKYGSWKRSLKARKKQLSLLSVGFLIVRGKSCDLTIAMTLSANKPSSALLTWKTYTHNTKQYIWLNITAHTLDTKTKIKLLSRSMPTKSKNMPFCSNSNSSKCLVTANTQGLKIRKKNSMRDTLEIKQRCNTCQSQTCRSKTERYSKSGKLQNATAWKRKVTKTLHVFVSELWVHLRS